MSSAPLQPPGRPPEVPSSAHVQPPGRPPEIHALPVITVPVCPRIPETPLLCQRPRHSCPPTIRLQYQASRVHRLARPAFHHASQRSAAIQSPTRFSRVHGTATNTSLDDQYNKTVRNFICSVRVSCFWVPSLVLRQDH
ncbi:uncharacterized protein LOC122878985 isoform X2 [Siniperca chuatsi]|uniref:uncharacterized protein LOC122878985 isoform X2 n=1 Tax=Siniperca chuatsi TaxID=119488 RepID=UPI001CE0B44B|nr:uncharacterized protein LOC122878985 isoform X2 [Siniperca chuatsi]